MSGNRRDTSLFCFYTINQILLSFQYPSQPNFRHHQDVLKYRLISLNAEIISVAIPNQNYHRQDKTYDIHDGSATDIAVDYDPGWLQLQILW